MYYAGWAENAISPGTALHYYEQVKSFMRSHTNSKKMEMDEFYRLFFVSGMDHCREGDGAWAIGQDTGAYAGTEPEENAVMALVRWVEEGVAPEVLRGAKLGEDGVTAEYWRAHCRWPKTNRYVGPVPATEESSWVCE